jgi:hypothetical protein
MAKQETMSFTNTAALSIPVKQFDKCIQFYNGVLGMTVYAQTEDKSFAALRAGDIDIWLIAENSFGQKFKSGNDSGPVPRRQARRRCRCMARGLAARQLPRSRRQPVYTVRACEQVVTLHSQRLRRSASCV